MAPGSLDRSVPGSQTFEAPSLQQLLADATSSSSHPPYPHQLALPHLDLFCLSGSVCPHLTSRSLSTGAKAGIGIAVALVGISLAVLAFSVLVHGMKRNSNNNEKPETDSSSGANDHGTQYTYAGGLPAAG